MIMLELTMRPVCFVHNTRKGISDDFWGNVISEITICDDIPESALEHIELFSHLEIIYYFDKVAEETVIYSGRPRGNPDYPVMGIFGQRKKDRPNRIGLCTAELIEHSGRTIRIRNLDAIDGTPVLDIKPVFKEFRSPENIRQATGWLT